MLVPEPVELKLELELEPELEPELEAGWAIAESVVSVSVAVEADPGCWFSDGGSRPSGCVLACVTWRWLAGGAYRAQGAARIMRWKMGSVRSCSTAKTSVLPGIREGIVGARASIVCHVLVLKRKTTKYASIQHKVLKSR